MATLLYIHGFLSSPSSFKAQQVKFWLKQQRPDIHYTCPQLTPYPDECANTLGELMCTLNQPVYLMGSSMGGFWASWLVENFGHKAILINPAVDVLQLMPHYLYQQLSNYHYPEKYYLTEVHLDQLQKYIIDQPTKLQNYWVLLQAGDETLDYRLAVEKYSGCRQTIESGGDHSFQHFERFLEPAIHFFESDTLRL